MGAAVASGFAAKYPTLCLSLSLISPLGVKYKPMVSEGLLSQKYVGEYIMYRQKANMIKQQELEFYDRDMATTHRYLIDKQSAMVAWQIKHTPGYLGAILSTYRQFPVRGMEELVRI
jgi:pimeloyl-ACP methyl ester carboxylesterase